MKFTDSIQALGATIHSKTIATTKAAARLATKVNEDILEPIADFTSLEVEKAKHWPSIINEKATNIKNAAQIKTEGQKVIETLVESVKDDTIQVNANDLSTTEELQHSQEPITEVIDIIKATDATNIPKGDPVKAIYETSQSNNFNFHLGDSDGEIVPLSKEYKKMIADMAKIAQEYPETTLTLSGKTYGLGARGEKDGENTVYTAGDIVKLYKKIS